MLDRYGLEFGGFRYFVAPQEEHLYPVVTVSSHALESVIVFVSSDAAESVPVRGSDCPDPHA